MRPLYAFAIFLVLYELAAYLANDMIMPGMIEVIHTFHASQNYVSLSLSAYLLGNCVFLLFAGLLSERYGKRNFMLIGNLLFIFFTVLVLFSRNIHQFTFWRFCEGGGLAIIAIGYGLIHHKFNDKDAVKLIALMSNVSLLAPLLGPVFGTLILSYFSWHYIFVFTALLGFMSLLGLIRYTPQDEIKIDKLDFSSLFKQYGKILSNKPFLLGCASVIFSAMPVLLWISQAPNLLLYKLHENYHHYVIYQLISIGGLVMASILMQYVAGKFRIATLIRTGMALLLSGLIIAALGSAAMIVVSIGFCIYSLGLGLANGCIFRLIMSNKELSTNISSTTLGFLQTTLFAFGIILNDIVCHYFDYSILSFTLSSLAFGLFSFGLMHKYLQYYQSREWE